MNKRRYAAHYVHTPSRGYLKQYGVEIGGGDALRIFPLEEEVEGTEWLPGVIRVEMSPEQRWEVWHYYPFDFINMTPVSETRRTRLR